MTRIVRELDIFHSFFREKKGIEKYKRYLSSRYRSFLYAFDLFVTIGGTTIVELGMSRSFVGGGRKGCMVNDVWYWNPASPRDWDWGAGLFTRMCAMHLQEYGPAIHMQGLVGAFSRAAAADDQRIMFRTVGAERALAQIIERIV